jgi:hypothetical protein
MYELKPSDLLHDDIEAARICIYEYFLRLYEIEKIDTWLDALEAGLQRLYSGLVKNPRMRQIYQFKPPIETHHDYMAAQVGWFTVFWWVDEEAQICHVYRLLNSKSDFTKAGSW